MAAAASTAAEARSAAGGRTWRRALSPLLCLLWLVGCGPDALAANDALCAADGDCVSGFCQRTPDATADEFRCADPDGDLDNDGLSNFAERLAGSSPTHADSDGDNLADAVEWGDTPNAPRDRDGDGRGDLIEHNFNDKDADCLADVDDPDDAAAASPAALANVACSKGVCNGNTPAARCNADRSIDCEPSAGVGFEAGSEVSCDGLDNDCDGQTDEALDGKAAAACGTSGVCLDAPSARCVAGQWLCNLALVPDWESVEKSCDGLDNDCDGQTDEAPICEDGIACTVDSCDASVGCVHIAGINACHDGNSCTNDLCDVREGCKQLSRVGICDDGNPCTSGESCQAAKCVGGALTPCDDGSTCTANPCDPQKGCLILPVAQGSACKPADACQLVGSCVGGLCQPTTAMNCDDGNVCTLDSCDNLDGTCGHGAIISACDDGNACTSDDACVGKLCVGTALPTCCENNAQCKDDNACTADTCSEGLCSNAPAAMNSADCDDSNACTTSSVCASGFCVATGVLGCDDGEPCTIDVCAAKKGCSHAPLGDGAGCDDGDACNGQAVCKAGVCIGGKAPVCDDFNPCTNDGCSAKSGCTHGGNTLACDDGNPCTRLDVCGAGSCHGAPIACSDDRPCTLDACDLAIGCVYLAKSGVCDDGDGCTSNDACDAGSCVGVAIACDDNNDCSIDSCVADKGCVHDSVALQGKTCSDGDACSVGDRCVGGLCTPELTVTCSDTNPCTIDSCDGKTGRCVHSQGSGSCVTSTGCTADATCKAALCTGVAIKSCCTQSQTCQDDNPCTLDICEKSDGTCSHQAITGVVCSDSDACTKGESCTAGLCRGGQAIVCADGNSCTADACLPASGCVAFATDGGPCSDGDACDGDEGCKGSDCVAGAALVCDDNNACTVDSCDAGSGCVYAGVVGVGCDDGSSCTTGDACDSVGACVGKAVAGKSCCSAASDCDDGFACTIDGCDLAKARCFHAARACAAPAACDVRSCSEGACVSAKRCDTPAVLLQPIEGAGLPGGMGVSTSTNATLVGWSTTPPGGGLDATSTRALHVGLGTGSSTATLPPLFLPKGDYALSMLAKVDAPGGCTTGALVATLNSKAFGPSLCGVSATVMAIDVPFTVTETGEMQLALRFDGSAAADPERGGFVDAIAVRALPVAGCICAESP